MAVMRWDPWGELAALQRDVNQLFARTPGERQATSAALVPPIDAYRSEGGLVVRMELAGMGPDDVEISAQEGVLTVAGERKADTSVEEENWLRRERAVGRFERSFTLPEGTDAEQITASFGNGLLELRIPHPPERKPHRVQIDQAGAEQRTVDVSGA